MGGGYVIGGGGGDVGGGYVSSGDVGGVCNNVWLWPRRIDSGGEIVSDGE